MSRLLERLERARRGPARAMGFRPTATQGVVPSLSLVAAVGEAGKSARAAVKNGADAIILKEPPKGRRPERRLEPDEGPPENGVWGLEAQQLDKDDADDRRGNGCDFLVFGLDGTHVEALEEGDCGRVLRLSHELEEAKLRCLEDLPIDVVLLNKPGPESKLSLGHLLAISNVRSATSRYVLLEWDTELTQWELEQLRDIGVDGIVASGEKAPALVTKLREQIDGLPPRRPRNERDQRSAVLPRVEATGQEGRQPAEPDEDDEEEW